MRSEQGFTIAELVVALLIFGLLISFLIPMYQEIKANAVEEQAILESTQLLADQVERLRQGCKNNQQGFNTIKPAQQVATYQLKWSCMQQDQTIQIDVEVQWKDKRGKRTNKQLRTHYFLSKQVSHISK